MRVVFFQRRPRPSGNYSLEAIFEDVRSRLAASVETRVWIAPCYSNGILRRIWIAISAALHQGQINHVTGDINFAAILLRKARTVLTVHDCGDVAERTGWRGWLLRSIWFRWPVKRSAHITTVSEASKRAIIDLTGCSPDKVTVIPNAINFNFTRQIKPFARFRPRLLQVGTSINKNVERLAEALSGLDCQLVIVGELSRSQRNELMRFNIDYENHVNLSEASLIRQFARSDIVVFASTYEGFGMPIIEGQSVGRPVVTSNVSSMPEVAGGAACLVDPLDVQSIRMGIERVITDEDYRNELVQLGFENVKRFDAEIIARQYYAIYQSIIPSDEP